MAGQPVSRDVRRVSTDTGRLSSRTSFRQSPLELMWSVHTLPAYPFDGVMINTNREAAAR
ncbi:hypothetical protein SAMN07250955_10798 [Arboricoccus pini]|uniref:Uncharacterized protein n=1 Tax=Arboricoccus pini TaxID=1963835 RepID=A0A212RCT8_9PROT|nr:hypothetical protein SAMN07250955_10798 [Arboricoccus pini]